MIEGTDYRLTPLLSEDEIQEKIKKIGRNLSDRVKNEVPIFIGVLNGSFIFMADLLRTMTINCEIDFIKLNSYAGE